MPLKFFIIPIRNIDAEAELNAFVHDRRVLSVERRWVDQGENSFWSICVDYLPTPHNNGSNSRNSAKGRVDYKQVLSPDDFAVFAKLRDLRKEFATEEAVPVYAIFTNEQLAQMARKRAMTKAALREIEGVGDAKIEKYADRFLDLIKAGSPTSDETNGKLVAENPGS